MKRLLIYLLFICFGCGHAECPKGINKLPMYGRVQKCKEQLQHDQEFIQACDKQFKDRQEGAKYYINRGWGYFYHNQFDTAIMRFNQAWLLDSLNADIYWGYGNILELRDKNFRASLDHFDRSLKLNPNNPRVWESASTSYGQLFLETKDNDLLNKSIEYLKASIRIEPGNVRTYSQLTAAYTYFPRKDSARKYLLITDKLDSNAVSPAVRDILTKE